MNLTNPCLTPPLTLALNIGQTFDENSVDILNLKLETKSQEGFEWELRAYSNSNFAGDKDNRINITSYIVYLFGASVA